jgi:GMP synthase-like glutamine amidotransferase
LSNSKGGFWAVDRKPYDWQGEVFLNAWHRDQVVQRPADATPVASNAFCENATGFMAYIFTVQAHDLTPHSTAIRKRAQGQSASAIRPRRQPHEDIDNASSQPR